MSWLEHRARSRWMNKGDDRMTDIRAVLFDVGGPINTESEHERLVDDAIVAALAEEGIEINPGTYAEASAWAVEHFAPDAYAAIIWRLTKRDRMRSERVHRRMIDLVRPDDGFELRDGISAVIASLHERGLLLALAANQPASMLAVLDAHGVGTHFDHREVSGTHGHRKPDVRLFLRCCEDLSVEPAECLMIGDRIDNDICTGPLTRDAHDSRPHRTPYRTAAALCRRIAGRRGAFGAGAAQRHRAMLALVVSYIGPRPDDPD